MPAPGTDQMKSILQSLIAFLSLNALAGGGLMLFKPDGSALGMSTDLLAYSPFKDFFIPGLFLFGVFGVGFAILFWAGIRNFPFYKTGIRVLAVLLLVWLLIQILSIRTFSWLQVLIAFTAVCLIIIPGHLRK